MVYKIFTFLHSLVYTKRNNRHELKQNPLKIASPVDYVQIGGGCFLFLTGSEVATRFFVVLTRNALSIFAQS